MTACVIVLGIWTEHEEYIQIVHTFCRIRNEKLKESAHSPYCICLPACGKWETIEQILTKFYIGKYY
jgi:hypothetical protein